MNLADIDIFPARVRALQAMYPEAHHALVNWGLWSRDRAGIFPGQIAAQPTWREATSGVPEGYAEEGEGAQVVDAPVKAERAEDEAYNELAGFILDERLHGPGGLSCELRQALRVAYVFRDIPEYQYAARAGCLPDHFCERLESALLFAGRFL